MAEINKGKWTAELGGDFVVFIIGPRISPRHPIAWIRDLGGRRGMAHMLNQLTADPDSGLLGYFSSFPVIVQYWRSFEHLEAFAADATGIPPVGGENLPAQGATHCLAGAAGRRAGEVGYRRGGEAWGRGYSAGQPVWCPGLGRAHARQARRRPASHGSRLGV